MREFCMTTLIAALISLMGTAPIGNIFDVKEKNGLMYCVYLHEEAVYLSSFSPKNPAGTMKTNDTGLSPAGLEHVTVQFNDGSVSISARYAHEATITNTFDMQSLDFQATNIVDQEILHAISTL